MTTHFSQPRMFRLNLEVDDLAAAADFYGALLGGDARPQMGNRVYVDTGAVTLQIVEVARPHLAAKALYFATADLDGLHAVAARLGCLSEEDVHGEPAGEARVRPWGERSFYCADPAGNPLCFVEEGSIYTG